MVDTKIILLSTVFLFPIIEIAMIIMLLCFILDLLLTIRRADSVSEPA